MGIRNIAVVYCDLMISILDMVGGFNQKILSLHCIPQMIKNLVHLFCT